jgi:hypothetical protein
MSISQPFTDSKEAYDPAALADTLGGLPTVIPDVGFLLLQPPSTIPDAIELGITVVMMADKPCTDDGPHEHDHAPLFAGRISYAKAHNLAVHLLELCAIVQPLDVAEQAIVARINEKIATLVAEREATVTHTEHTGPFSVI